VRVCYQPSIRGGTRWGFFASEVALLSLQLLLAPAVWQSPLARRAALLHVGMHAAFASIDFFAHDFLLASALTARRRNALMWLGKELGLVIDTATHAIVVAVVVRALPLAVVVFSTALALGAYTLVTRRYIRRYGVATEL
jgi:hypothetical protein